MRGEQRVNESHRPPRDTRPRRDILHTRFAEFGEIGARFFEGLWQAHRHAASQSLLFPETSNESDESAAAAENQYSAKGGQPPEADGKFSANDGSNTGATA